jgi:hypothetical protein
MATQEVTTTCVKESRLLRLSYGLTKMLHFSFNDLEFDYCDSTRFFESHIHYFEIASSSREFRGFNRPELATTREALPSPPAATNPVSKPIAMIQFDDTSN